MVKALWINFLFVFTFAVWLRSVAAVCWKNAFKLLWKVQYIWGPVISSNCWLLWIAMVFIPAYLCASICASYLRAISRGNLAKLLWFDIVTVICKNEPVTLLIQLCFPCTCMDHFEIKSNQLQGMFSTLSRNDQLKFKQNKLNNYSH